MGGGTSTEKRTFEGDLWEAVIQASFTNRHLNKCNTNTAYWVSLATLYVTASYSCNSSEVKFIAKKDTEREILNRLGLIFFNLDSRKDEASLALHNDVLRELREKLIETLHSQTFSDEHHYFKDHEDVYSTLIEVFGSHTLPSITVHWNYWNNSHTLSKLAFYGLGQCKNIVLVSSLFHVVLPFI
jgi:hypothetical protein